jgi:hypothetical protein
MAGISRKNTLHLIFLMPLIRDAIADGHFAPTWLSMAVRMQLAHCWFGAAWASAKWDGWYDPALNDEGWPDWVAAMGGATAAAIRRSGPKQGKLGLKGRLPGFYSNHLNGDGFAASPGKQTQLYSEAISQLAPPGGLSLPWLLAMDLKSDESLRDLQDRVRWAVQAKEGRKIAEDMWPTVFRDATEAELRTIDPSKSSVLKAPGVLASIARHLGPAGDEQWLRTGKPTPPAFYTEAPGYWRVAERRAQVAPSLPYAVAQDALELLGILLAREQELRRPQRWSPREHRRSAAAEAALVELRQAMISAVYQRTSTPCPPPVEPDQEVTSDDILAALPVERLLAAWATQRRSSAEDQYRRGEAIDLPPTADGRRFVIYPRYMPGYAQPAEIAALPEYADAPVYAQPMQRLTSLAALRDSHAAVAEAAQAKPKLPARSRRP